jgi:hypothetical protein
MSPRSRYLAAGLLAVAPFAAPDATAPFVSDGDPDVRAEVVTTLRDPAIDESSGLVVRGGRLFTVNDSGDGPYVYEVDLQTGQTVGVTTYGDEEPEDVEALAPGRRGALWVADIGDNRRGRASVRVHRVVPRRGGGTVRAATFDLAYPDGPHDAEALLVDPRSGRLLVVTKRFAGGGVVYQTARRLREGETQVLERVARVSGLVTDGTFLPGGDRVLLRTYGSASLYSYPEFELLAQSELPAQEQGEAVAVGEDGRVYLSSEGERSDVLAVELPRPARADGDETPAPSTPEPTQRREYDPEPWLGLGPGPVALLVVGAGAVVLLVRAALRRGRRRR